MNASKTPARRKEEALENFVAELTEAAYPVALRRGVGDRWLDLELELWKVLNEAVRKWDRQALLPR
jgi:aminoglycoside phosphotransferase